MAVMGALMLLSVAKLSATEFGLITRMAGEDIYSYFGMSVALAGDVNGDGYDDVIVGAPGYSDVDTGAAYIYFGGPSMDSVCDVRILGEMRGMGFGRLVAPAGDVNGDGYDDVLVGGYYNYGPYGSDSFAIAVYIYFGSQNMDPFPDVKIVTERIESGFYTPIAASAGDVNGDGYDDVIVGVPWHRAGVHPNVGAAQIYFGGLPMDSLYDVRLLGENTNDRLGYTVSSAGDVNGDGYDDVLVSQIHVFYGGLVDTGIVYVFYGGHPMDETYDVMIKGRDANELFGYSLASAGDINGDGYDDLIVGAYGYDTTRGAARIYFGSTSMDSVTDLVLMGEGIDDHFGYSVASAGDVNGDGYDDVIVGAYGYDTLGATGLGAAYIYLGGTAMDTLYYSRIVGENIGDHFAISVSSAGDVDGDGQDDIIVGAQDYGAPPYTSQGAAYVYGLNTPMVDEDPDFGRLQLQLSVTPNITMNTLRLNFHAEGGHVKINIVNVNGRDMLTVYDGHLDGGWHEQNFDVSALSDGVYFVLLQVDGAIIASRKFQIVR